LINSSIENQLKKKTLTHTFTLTTRLLDDSKQLIFFFIRRPSDEGLFNVPSIEPTIF